MGPVKEQRFQHAAQALWALRQAGRGGLMVGGGARLKPRINETWEVAPTRTQVGIPTLINSRTDVVPGGTLGATRRRVLAPKAVFDPPPIPGKNGVALASRGLGLSDLKEPPFVGRRVERRRLCKRLVSPGEQAADRSTLVVVEGLSDRVAGYGERWPAHGPTDGEIQELLKDVEVLCEANGQKQLAAMVRKTLEAVKGNE